MKKMLFAFVLVCLGATVASATTSCTGESTVASGGTLAASVTDAIASTGGATTFSGTVTSCAYTGDFLNPFSISDVSFIYQVSVNSGSNDVSGVTFGNFGSALLKGADFTCAGCTASVLNGTNGTGGYFFDFSPVLGAGGSGGTSDYLVVYTNQTTIAPGVASLHDTSETGLANDLATVPEPASLTLVGTGLLGLAGLLRRKLLQV